MCGIVLLISTHVYISLPTWQPYHKRALRADECDSNVRSWGIGTDHPPRILACPVLYKHSPLCCAIGTHCLLDQDTLGMSCTPTLVSYTVYSVTDTVVPGLQLHRVRCSRHILYNTILTIAPRTTPRRRVNRLLPFRVLVFVAPSR